MNQQRRWLVIAWIIALFLIASALFLSIRQGQLAPWLASSPVLISQSPSARDSSEHEVVVIPLAGLLAEASAEISGLAWYGENLVLLPQYPQRMSSSSDGALFALSKADLSTYLDGVDPAPLTPLAIALETGGLEGRVPGFEGFEAIAFTGDRFFVTIEAKTQDGMTGYLASGEITPDLSAAYLDPETLVENPLQLDRDNHSDEAIVINGEQIFTLYEVNGRELNNAPKATVFDLELNRISTMPFPNIDYRVTDATPPVGDGRFWVINYFFPGESYLRSDRDLLATPPGGAASSHAHSQAVERLVEFQITPGIIMFTPTPPVYLRLLPDGEARNWEGIAYLPGRGFLLATDKFPGTILGFVEYP
jgi:hypothetical protein